MDQPNPAPGSTPSSDQELTATFERIEARVREFQALQTTRRRRAVLMTLLLFGAACWFVWQVLLPIRTIANDPRTFIDAFEREETTVFLPLQGHEFRKTLPKVATAVETAFRKEWDSRQPHMESIVRDLEQSLSVLGRHLNIQATGRVHTFLDRYQERLEKDLPGIADDEETLAAIHAGLEGAITTVIGSRFHQPFETLNAMADTFLALPVPDTYAKMSDTQLQEVMLEQINAYLNLHFDSFLGNLKVVREGLATIENRLFDTIDHLEADLPGAASPAAPGEGGRP